MEDNRIDNRDPEILLALQSCLDKIEPSIQVVWENINPFEKYILHLRWIDGLTLKVIANMTGSSIATVFRNLESAEKIVKEIIVNYAMEEYDMNRDDVEDCMRLIAENCL